MPTQAAPTDNNSILSEFNCHRLTLLSGQEREGWQAELHQYLKDMPANITKDTDIMELSQASPVPPCLKRGSDAKPPSLPSPPLKPSYSQIVKTKIPPHDTEKQARDPGKVTCDSSRDPLPALVPCDQSCVQTQSRDPTRFGCATHLLISTWKTVGTNQRSMRSQGSQGIPHSLSPMDTGTGNTFIGLRA